jgi:hypothetical protein
MAKIVLNYATPEPAKAVKADPAADMTIVETAPYGDGLFVLYRSFGELTVGFLESRARCKAMLDAETGTVRPGRMSKLYLKHIRALAGPQGTAALAAFLKHSK